MEFDRKTILAFVLIGFILLLVNTDFYKRLLFNGAPTPPPTEEPASKSPGPAAFKPQVRSSEVSTMPAAEEPSQKRLHEAYAGTEVIREEKIFIETPFYLAEMSNRGGVITRVELKEYLNVNREPVTIFADDDGSPNVLLPIGQDTLDTEHLMFSVSGGSTKLDEKESKTLTFEHRLRSGQLLRKTFTFAADKYDIELKVELDNIRSLTDAYCYVLQWQSPLLSTEQNTKDDMGHAKVYAMANKDLEKYDVGSDPQISERENEWTTTWIAARTKYFATAIIPQGTSGNGFSVKGFSSKDENDNPKKRYTYSLFMPFYREGSEGYRFKIYIGPLKYSVLKSYDVDLHRMMDLGWKWVVEPFSVIALLVFNFLHEYIPNYGFVIVIFSILVKIILNPLTRRSTRSMKEMQLLQPKIAELREKYQKDPQRLNQETMKLYSEHGVNPLGGCLPTLLQMPLLFALFVVFSAAIELRQAPFILWIKDLSVSDTIYRIGSIPINILPLLMGATMFLQQQMTATDPKQKFMMYMMPVIFTFMFYGFPSGLTLYYSLFNIMSLIQQKYFTDTKPIELKRKKKKTNRWKKMSFNEALGRSRARR
jgi:YidC/Oxa1 family membrane protein insertase